MPRVDQATYEERKMRVFLTLRRYPNGLTEADLEQVLRTNRRTLNNYLRALEMEGKVYKDGLTWVALPYDELRLRSFELSPEEAMTLYLATRLLARQHDKRNEPAETALMKLAAALRSHQIAGEEIHQAAQELAQRPSQGEYLRVFRAVMQAFIYRRVLHITYEPLHGTAFATDFEPYLIEPSAIGFSTYVIGRSSIVNAIRTYKLERIKAATLTRQEYVIPREFGGLEVLKSAWSVIYGESLLTVVLRFSPAVRKRVEETRWHFSEDKRDDPDKPGYLLWQARVADTLDMLPWIRGWGADCEVLAPPELRQELEREARRLAEVYKIQVKRQDELIAHRRKKDGEEQPLVTHLIQVAQLAEKFAAKVSLPEVGKIAGLLHDFGKASQEYQNYLRTHEGLINPDEDNYSKARRGEVDHSTAGAQLVYKKLAERGLEGKILAQFLALAIASHHSGLIDCLKPDGFNEFQRRIEKEDAATHLEEARSKLPDIEKQLDEILAQPLEKQFFEKIMGMRDAEKDVTLPFKHGLLARFLLSCVLEADRLNTADFEHPNNEAIRNYGKYVPWDVLIERLEAKYAEYAQETAQMKPGRALEVNQLRAQVAQACLEAAGKSRGLYQLTVPTGGGKTEASLRFALHHAKAHQMDRVFYIVPYITIIDQNADKIRDILETADERGKVVLEHHSNFVPEEDTRYRHNLLAENWDAPIVFTTQVQFLEALFGYGTRDARRMHQLANSVIIFDEVQTVPLKITHMFNAALRFLTHDCGATVVLCTATQPPLDKLPNEYRRLTIAPEYQIIQNPQELFEKLKRVEVHDERKSGGWTNAEIADLAERALQEKGSVLIVVNTRPSALAVYQEIKNRNLGVPLYHLSTNMCAAHREDVLEKEIKPKLKANEPVICVSTQLIEAGVDIDFGAVIRSLAGLDSIAQSAGRCNRHGMREDGGSVWVVNPQKENLDRLKDIQSGREHAQWILDDFKDNPEDFGSDPLGLETITRYYQRYYAAHERELDYPVSKDSPIERDDTLFNLLSTNRLSTINYQASHQEKAPDILLRQSFRSASGVFRVIDSPTRGVIVPYREGKNIITELCGAFGIERQGKLLKRAQRYSVNLFDHQFRKLLHAGAIQEVQKDAGIYYLNEQYYSDKFGWSEEPVSNMNVLIQ